MIIRKVGKLLFVYSCWFLGVGLGLILTACTAPRLLPEGPTPIPTLIPATQPASPVGEVTSTAYVVLSYPARPPSVNQGQSLYQTNCSRCHGEDGRGVVAGARNFNDLDYMRGENLATFYIAVTEGQGDMPSFGDQLSSDERWDIVAYVWRFSTDAQVMSLGQTQYISNCAACHGLEGNGMVLGASDFTDLHLMSDRARRDFYQVITQGKGSMPAWQGRLSQDERWAVIDYMYNFVFDTGMAAVPSEAATPATDVIDTSCIADYLDQTNPFTWEDASAISAGKAIYSQSCVFCHGPQGEGALPGAPDFTASETQTELRAESGEFLCLLAVGKGTMPAWKDKLTNEQMWQVLTYLGSLGK